MDTEPGPDGLPRCAWAMAAPEFLDYHDLEWGFPVHDDVRLFEKLSLEAFQSGLSWRTILNKREAFREVFHGFDPARVAAMGDGDVRRLLDDARIIRHRGKIEAVIHNSRRLPETVGEETLAKLVWSFEPPRRTRTQPQATSPESVAVVTMSANKIHLGSPPARRITHEANKTSRPCLLKATPRKKPPSSRTMIGSKYAAKTGRASMPATRINANEAANPVTARGRASPTHRTMAKPRMASTQPACPGTGSSRISAATRNAAANQMARRWGVIWPHPLQGLLT